MRSTITGTAKVMTYHDIVAAERQRDAKVKGKREKKSTERTPSGVMVWINPKVIPQSLLPPGPSRRREMEAIGMLTAYSFVS